MTDFPTGTAGHDWPPATTTAYAIPYRTMDRTLILSYAVRMTRQSIFNSSRTVDILLFAICVDLKSRTEHEYMF